MHPLFKLKGVLLSVRRALAVSELNQFLSMSMGPERKWKQPTFDAEQRGTRQVQALGTPTYAPGSGSLKRHPPFTVSKLRTRLRSQREDSRFQATGQ